LSAESDKNKHFDFYKKPLKYWLFGKIEQGCAKSTWQI